MKKHKWIYGLILVLAMALALALATGCAGRQEEAELDWEAEFNLLAGTDEDEPKRAGTEPAADDPAETPAEAEPWADPNADLDPEMAVASVNGRDIPVRAVLDELHWAMEIVFWENMDAFPQDQPFSSDMLLEDGTSFGRASLEQAVQMAAHVMLYEEYAAQNGIITDPHGMSHRVVQIIHVIMADPELFAEFEEFMPEYDGAFYYALEKAEALLARAHAGEDFDMLIQTYGEDPGMETYPDGYTFVSGDMVPEFENATLELEIGEISGLVISQFGIHIIKRVEPIAENLFRGPPPEDPDEMLGAKHILIMGTDTSQDRMFQAILAAFEEKVGAAEIEFFDTLEEICVDVG